MGKAAAITGLVLALAAAVGRPDRPGIRGVVVGPDRGPAAGVLVTATRGHVSVTVATEANGGFELQLDTGAWEVRARAPGLTSVASRIEAAEGGPAARITLVSPSSRLEPPSSKYLGLLPDGEAKRRYVLDCTGCHGLHAGIAYPGGQERDDASWREAVGRMLSFAGPSSGFPVIAAGREPAATAAWLRTALPAAPPVETDGPPGHLDYEVIEYAMPEPRDLPHDIAVDEAGRAIVTGMFTHRMYVIDPATHALEEVSIPLAQANPRAVEIAPDQAWWVVLGAPMMLARRDAASGEWRTFPVGVYPHSVALDSSGAAWYNGHFTRNPEVLGRVAPDGAVETFEVPAHPQAHIGAGPMPYEVRIAPDGGVWGSELLGNRVYRYDPEQGGFRLFDMPTPHSGPRRLDVARDGSVWIPEYAAGRLARLDPAAGTIREWELPVKDAAPYVVRVHPRTGAVWIGTGAADALFVFDPDREEFRTIPLPSRNALVRHLAIDPGTGDVWAAYGASPGPPAKVARVRER